ncbi:cysteine hydrolase family protein [Endozoicomonas elysicola]|uniref:Isochorismatase n=1 Tax=Endozoicomonas elysicola TaxID=305900 RepID=A0A081K5S6_9GAMM|nr:cysteine hydrolase family protein [Endozoicomonas elysicola]KEI69502.1 isochorismatase [Endozoicomonas elysicola]
MGKKALLVIDLQKDYFPGGKYPLWNTKQTLANIKNAMTTANKEGIPIVLIQHIADPALGLAPFFNKGSGGEDLLPEILALAPDADIVIKTYADGFEKTNLDAVLQEHGVTKLLVCGMMTQNCVTHTAISKAAEKYKVSILMDCCTTVDEMIHMIALHAVSTRVPLITMDQAF